MACSDCSGGCLGCGVSCSRGCSSCSDSCGKACSSGCARYCDSSCINGCSGCGSGCGSNCQKNTSACSGDCSITCRGGCTGCDSSCDGCDRSCGGSCSGKCSYGCDSSCGGCDSSCSGCGSGCSSYCNTSCTSANRSQEISNLGKQIVAGNISNYNDFISLKDEIRFEIRRRGKIPTTDFTSMPIGQGIIPAKLVQNIFDNAKLGFNSGFTSTEFKTNPYKEIKVGDIVRASDYEEVIKYIKYLMSTVVEEK